jgi:hypothetical protein
MSVQNWVPILALTTIVTGGCASQAPTIAHVHVGHALTGWRDTPGKEGFFVVAEDKAQQALDSAESASKTNNDINKIKSDINLTVEATNPSQKTIDGKKRYGVKQSLEGAVDHITFAADSDDASKNIKSSVKAIANNTTTILERCDLIRALGEDIKMTASVDEAVVLTAEVLNLARANVHGEDSDADGIVGSNPSEYGLAQLRMQLDAMVAREDPPYTTVDSWYLFNLVRLPTGKWEFREETSGLAGYDDPY